jgi:hypothetical protein
MAVADHSRGSERHDAAVRGGDTGLGVMGCRVVGDNSIRRRSSTGGNKPAAIDGAVEAPPQP